MKRLSLLLLFFIYPFVSFPNSSAPDSLLLKYHNAANDSIRLDLLDGIAYYWAGKNSDSCILYGKELIHEAVNSNDTMFIYYGFLRVLDQFNSLGIYDSSLYYSFQALPYLQNDTLYKFQHTRLLSMIGEQYRATGQYGNAIHYLQESWAIANKTDKLSFKSQISNRFAAVYFEMEQYDKALLWADSSLRFAYMANNKSLIINNLTVKGAINRNKGDYQQALKTLWEAARYIKELSDTTRLSNVYNNIAITYFYLKDYKNTIKYARESYDISSSANLKALTVVALDFLAKAYAEVGEFDLAYKYLRIYERMHNDIFNEEKNKQISELNTKYETQKKEQQIKTQISLLEKKDLKIRQNRVVGFLFLIIFLSLSAFTAYIFTTRKKLKKKNWLLTDKNSQIIKQKTKIETYATKVDDAYKKLKELDEYKQAMTSMLVHDLKNPLNLLVNLDVFENEKEKGMIVTRASKQMLNLIMNLLDINKAENNSLALDKTNVDLFEIIRLSFQETDFLCLQKNIKTINKSAFNYSFLADREILIRVFINLLTNAIKYSPSNSTIIIDTAITSGNLLTITVQDKGIGIAKELHETIFEKFMQVKKIKSGQIGSTGLGLAFCKVAVESHNWDIGVESEPGKGASFWIKIKDYQKTGQPDALSENGGQTESEKAEMEIPGDDLPRIRPYLLALEELDVYRISDIKKIISDIKKENIEGIKPWLNKIRKAAETLNEEKYLNLMKVGKTFWAEEGLSGSGTEA